MERFNPLNDYLFLKVMGEKGDEEQCLAFLNAVLADSSERPLKLVEILENRSVSAENLGDKSVSFDFRALGETETQKNIKVEIEVQLKDLRNMTERTLYYWAREYVAGIKEGEDYGDLPRVITINIVNFDHVKLEKFHTAFRLREDVHREYVLTDVMEIHFLNMVKFRKRAGKERENTLERWLMFLDEYTTSETLAEIMLVDPAIAAAQRRLEEVTQNEEFRQNYLLRQKALSDWTTGVNTALEKGRKEGMAEGVAKGMAEGVAKGMAEGVAKGMAEGVAKGMAEGVAKGMAEGVARGITEGVAKGMAEEKIDIAKNALSEGLPVETIKKITGLDEQMIISLKNGE